MRTMVGSLSEDFVATDGGVTGMQHCQSVESLVEWRSCDQVENGTPSTSPPYWDTDDDDDVGPKPFNLYGKFTWDIENFSQISKRELRSNAFEVGGYKWYILIYPQGCDVCNYLSLFLCVANHDKLLPGWSHFAQFTIAVVNKDPKKNKYSDTLHRFWKKEHDWGWKKFMELSKISDGFADDDMLTIKAQVQVIREKVHRPFRCLDCQYRRELIRVYVSSVEQTCRRYVEERRDKLSKLVEDKVKWSSFHAFWLGMDQNVRRGMSRDKTGTILKLVVKQFFIEKEVISTLVMDSLYSGLRALEFQSKRNKGRARIPEKEELPAPMVVIEEDMFVLADDVFLLLERAALESLPHQPVPPKDDKVIQNRAKDGTSGDEFSRDSIVRDERRLTELGRRTLEIFVLAHIFSSRIEIAYKETVALKRQEELIREEEAAGQAEIELKAKRSALEKEKRARKKQAKQRRCNRKGKDRGKDEKPDGAIRVKIDDLSPKEAQKVHEKFDKRGDVSDVSDPIDDVDEASQADEEDKDNSPNSWETITSEIHPTTEASINAMQNGYLEKKNPSSLDDSSSTSSTDSVLSVVGNGPYKSNPSPNGKNNQSSSRGKKQWSKDIQTRSSSDVGQVLDANGSCRPTWPESVGKLHLKDQIHRLEHTDEKVEVAMTLEKQLIDEDKAKVVTGLEPRTTELSSSSSTPSRKLLPVKQPSTITTASGSPYTNEPTSNIPTKVILSVPSPTRLSLTSSISRSEAPKNMTQPMTTTVHPASSMSRPSSAPLIPGTRTTASLVSTTQTSPLLSRTLSSICHLVTEPCSSAQSYEPQSYRNAIMGIKTAKEPSSAAFTSRPSLPPSSQSVTLPQPHSSFSSSSSTQTSMTDARKELVSVDPGFSSVSGKPGSLCTLYQSVDHWQHVMNKNNTRTDSENQSCPSQGGISDEFPHLDIINDLLDEDQIAGRTSSGYYHQHDHHPMDRQYTFPRDSATTDSSSLTSSGHFDLFEPYYDDVSQMAYDSYGLPFQLLGDALPLQVDLLAYGSGQMDARFQNQWPIGSADMSMLSFTGNLMDMDAYAYQFPGLSTCVGGYNMLYQPANGF